MIDTDRQWRLWGDKDPYFGALAAPEFRRDQVDVDYFFLTGEAYAADRLAMLERQLGVIPRRRALDFGCGVGRVALPLGAQFDEVVGLDISPGMLEEAERLRLERDVRNVHYRLADDALRGAGGLFDFVHSYIVFQHIPPARGLGLIARLLDRVAQGGIANIHVAIGREPARNAAYHWARANIPGFRALTRRLRGRGGGEPMMLMNVYRLSEILAMMHLRGFGQAVVDVERHGRYLTAHVAARREAMEEAAA